MQRNRIVNLVSLGGLLLSLVFMAGCVPAEPGAEGTSYLPLLILLALVFGMVYFLMIRPLRQREKKHDRMVLELDKGDTVITAGGIYGVVDHIEDDSLVLKIESGATIRVTKGGVLRKQEE